LEHELQSAAISQDGIRLGNVCHRLRCRYGYRFNTLQLLSGLPAEDFDALLYLAEIDSEMIRYGDY
jgi:hypothetical protein